MYGRGRWAVAARRLAERHALQAQHECGKSEQQAEHQNDRERGGAREGRGDDEELAHEDAQRRQTRDRKHADDEAPAQPRLTYGEARDVGDPLRALDLRNMADGEEDRRFGQAVHRHVQQPREIGECSAHAEREDDDPHMLDRGEREQAFDVAPAVQHEGGEDQRDEAERRHQRARCDRARIGVEQQLEPQHRIQRHVE